MDRRQPLIFLAGHSNGHAVLLTPVPDLTFSPGLTTKTITIVMIGDSRKESNETFFVDLFGDSSDSLFQKSRGAGTILNDD